MITVFLKVASTFAMILLGLLSNKAGVLPDEANDYLVALLLDITCPCLILYSMASRQLDGEALGSALLMVGGTFLYFVGAALLSALLARLLRYEPREDRGVLAAVMTGSSVSFMGFPVSLAAFGQEAFFLMVIANVVLTIYLYFILPLQMKQGQPGEIGQHSKLSTFVNLCTISTVLGVLIFAFRVPLPGPVLEFLSTVGSATVPLSMLVVGM